MLLIVRLHVPSGWFIRKGPGLSVSKLPTAETLDPGIITNRPEWRTVSLIMSVWYSRGSGWLAHVVQPACNWSHFITHFPG